LGRTTYKEWNAPPVRDFADRVECHILEASERHVVSWRKDVDQVMWNPATLCQIWLGNTNVEATVQVPGVCVDDFGRDALTEMDA
jgi:hypothetical protein